MLVDDLVGAEVGADEAGAGNVVLDGELAGPPGSVWVAGIMVLPGVSGVTIQGFDIRNFTQGISVLDGANDIVIKDTKVSDSTDAGIVLWYAAAVAVDPTAHDLADTRLTDVAPSLRVTPTTA